VKQVQPGEGITISSAAAEDYPFSTLSFTDTDLVIVVTLHPISAGGIAGYAYCAQSDQVRVVLLLFGASSSGRRD
jgi:hypothetical protein